MFVFQPGLCSPATCTSCLRCASSLWYVRPLRPYHYSLLTSLTHGHSAHVTYARTLLCAVGHRSALYPRCSKPRFRRLFKRVDVPAWFSFRVPRSVHCTGGYTPLSFLGRRSSPLWLELVYHAPRCHSRGSLYTHSLTSRSSSGVFVRLT